MIRFVLPAAVIAMSLPVAAGAQTGQPVPIFPPPNPMTTSASASTATSAAIVGQPQPGPGDYQGYSEPAAQPVVMQPNWQPGVQPMALAPVPAGSVWIAGHYNWDPSSNNYVWLEGQYLQPPHPGAQWVPGHWQQTPNAWVWVDGNWQ
jgi:hypothetical protein